MLERKNEKDFERDFLGIKIKIKAYGKEKVDIKKEKYDYYYSYTDFPKTVLLRKPIITVCYLVTEKGDIGRGISVCSRQDEFNDIEGKKIAKHNAIRSLKHRSVPLIRRREAVNLLIQARCPFIKKGELNPVLSWWEKKFLFGKKEMYKNKKNWVNYSQADPIEDIKTACGYAVCQNLINCKCLPNLMAMNMIEDSRLIAELISFRDDLTERKIVDEVQKLASESIYSTHDILRQCIDLAEEGRLMLWEKEGVKL